MSYEESLSNLDDVILNDPVLVAAAVRMMSMAMLAAGREGVDEFALHADENGVRVTSTEHEGRVVSGEGPTPLLAMSDLEESIAKAAEAEENEGDEWKQGP